MRKSVTHCEHRATLQQHLRPTKKMLKLWSAWPKSTLAIRVGSATFRYHRKGSAMLCRSGAVCPRRWTVSAPLSPLDTVSASRSAQRWLAARSVDIAREGRLSTAVAGQHD